MALSMYQGSVPVFLQLLSGLNGVLDKAAQQAAAKKLDWAVLMNWRLYPDMFTLARQVKATCDHATNGAGRTAGVELPKLPDADATFEDMKTRIAKTIDFLKTIKPNQLDGLEDKEITIPMGGQPRTFKGQNYLYHMAMVNFYFHVTTAYNILRSLGFDIGKRDYMGQMPS